MVGRSAGGAAVRRWLRHAARWVRVGWVGVVARGWMRGAAIVGSVVVLGSAAGCALLWWSPWFRVTDVQVVNAGGQGLREVASVISTRDKPLVQVDTEGVAAEVMRTGRFVSVAVVRRWPSTLVLDAVPRVPVVAVEEGDGRVRLVDASGAVYEDASSPLASVVHLRPEGGALLPGERGNRARRAAVEAVLGFDAAQRGRITALRVDTGGLVSLRFDKIDVVWGGAGRSRLKAEVVVAMSRQPDIARIDVTAPTTPATLSRSAASTG